jgi:hypothetical protein
MYRDESECLLYIGILECFSVEILCCWEEPNFDTSETFSKELKIEIISPFLKRSCFSWKMSEVTKVSLRNELKN